jgi:hypothetical protein
MRKLNAGKISDDNRNEYAEQIVEQVIVDSDLLSTDDVETIDTFNHVLAKLLAYASGSPVA